MPTLTAEQLETNPSTDSLECMSKVLRRHWGYANFRPGQQGIIASIAAGRDACVVMPTGGGKSLCYQVPALLDAQRTAVVVSPLIALMQDQVAQLEQMGISAAFMNSSVPPQERGEILKRATSGEFRLLYLSPERVAFDGTSAWLKQVPVSFFAIDEAHCISEWGHEFRPEYRQLSRLRELFPDRPIAAFTASATHRVRHDIIEQLRLRDPYKHIASFRRPNLHYIVRECKTARQLEQLLLALRRISDGNAIVYAPTVARVGETVDFLAENGIAAVGYHGQMDAKARRENQEKWMSEEVRVLVGTLAFGLGINKANVRAVIHLSLPKSVEQYYQEAGRAGRDGLAADCLLLWQRKDAGLHAHFIGQIADDTEREHAWQRYHEVQQFVASADCRQYYVCRHFGEQPKWQQCGKCDVCAGIPEWLEHPVRGSGVSETAPGNDAFLPSPLPTADAELREYLREWRRNIARSLGIAAFVVLHDTALDALCRAKPQTLRELRTVPGFGDKKVERYGAEILSAFQRFGKGERASKDWHAAVGRPARETLQLLQEGRTFEEIAQIRGRQLSTVLSTVCNLIERGETQFRPHWISTERYAQIAAAFANSGEQGRLKPIKEALPEQISYGEIRLVAAHLRAQQTKKPTLGVSA